jgi:translation initiation factor IF-2
VLGDHDRHRQVGGRPAAPWSARPGRRSRSRWRGCRPGLRTAAGRPAAAAAGGRAAPARAAGGPGAGGGPGAAGGRPGGGRAGGRRRPAERLDLGTSCSRTAAMDSAIEPTLLGLVT